jgi:hypothetical protein
MSGAVSRSVPSRSNSTAHTVRDALLMFESGAA